MLLAGQFNPFTDIYDWTCGGRRRKMSLEDLEPYQVTGQHSVLTSNSISDLTLLLLPVACHSVAISAEQKRLAVRFCYVGM